LRSGLTTGGIPTFFDARNNFDSAEIEEDNVVDQLRANGRKIVLLGDDTWAHLFPNRWVREDSLSPLEVKDLHSVDDLVLKYLMPELRGERGGTISCSGLNPICESFIIIEWDLLIAHLVGVDHVGHRFGPDHPAMREKLGQMEDMLSAIISHLNAVQDNDTILFLFGDHGMTPEGDHGGASDFEADATLFVYSAAEINTAVHIRSNERIESLKRVIGFRSVRQTDLAPTVALLLGVPIPFASLGSLIPELFMRANLSPSFGRDGIYLVDELLSNVLASASFYFVAIFHIHIPKI
jgi:phosphatidylinositol glycan class O